MPHVPVPLRRWRQSTFLPIRLKEPSVSSERSHRPHNLRVSSFPELEVPQGQPVRCGPQRTRSNSASGSASNTICGLISRMTFGRRSLRLSPILFTPTASKPYLADETLLKHAPTVLHLSLRDICVNVVLALQNIVDDVDHCLKAGTSLHLAETATGNRNFVSGTLVDVLEGKVKLDHDRPRTFRPLVLVFLMSPSAILSWRPQRRPARQSPGSRLWPSSRSVRDIWR